MKFDRDNSLLPKGAVWIDDGTDPQKDAEWLAAFHHTSRHYRLYDSYTHPFETGHPNNQILFGVVLIETDNIEISRGGILSPSPSLIAQLNQFPGRKPAKNPEATIYPEFLVGGYLDAFQFESDIGFRLGPKNIKHDKIRWKTVQSHNSIEKRHQEWRKGAAARQLKRSQMSPAQRAGEVIRKYVRVVNKNVITLDEFNFKLLSNYVYLPRTFWANCAAEVPPDLTKQFVAYLDKEFIPVEKMLFLIECFIGLGDQETRERKQLELRAVFPEIHDFWRQRALS